MPPEGSGLGLTNGWDRKSQGSHRGNHLEETKLIKRALGRLFKSLDSMLHGGDHSFFWPGQDSGNKVDLARQVGTGFQSSVLMAPIQFIQRVFPDAPLIMKQKGEVLETHKLLDKVKRPNPHYSGTKLWMSTILSYLLDGNAYWLKVRNAQGGIAELWYTPHWLLAPKWSRGEFVSHYDYSPMGVPIRVEPEDVVHFRFGLDPRNPRIGMSPISSLLREIFTDDEAANFTAAVLRNMGVIGAIISPKNELDTVSKPEAEDIKLKFNQNFGGSNRGGVMVMLGPTDVQTVGNSPKDMDLTNLRNISEERVCAVLGIPAAVVGFGTGLESTKVGATMLAFIRLAWTGGIKPYQRQLSEDLATSLLPDYESSPEEFEVMFDHSEVEALQESENERIERILKGVSAGTVLVSEAREAQSLEVHPGDAVYLRGMAIIEVPVAGPRPVAFPGDDQKGWKERRRPTQQQARYARLLDRRLNELSSSFEKELSAFFEDLGKDAEQAAHQVLKSRNPQGAKAGESGEVAEIMSRMSGTSIDTLKGKGGTHYLNVGTQTFGDLSSVLGVTFVMTDLVAERIIAAGGRHMGLVDLTKQTRDRMFRELTAGRELGEGVDTLIRRIRDNIPAGPWRDTQTRARVIARTETKHAQRTSVLEGAKESGVVAEMLVVDARLGETDEDCEFWNGQVVGIAQAEQLASEEHPNGTRDFVPVIA